MKTCIHALLCAAVLLTVVRAASVASDHQPRTGHFEQFAEAADWAGETEESEDDSAFEDDFASNDDESGLSSHYLRNGAVDAAQFSLKEHHREIVSPPPQS